MNPLLTVLSFSGGKQSSCLLWMILLDKISIPNNFVVLNADPGMENSFTYQYVDMMKEKCKEKGIEFYKVQGENLYSDIVTLGLTNKKRLDTPAYWTKNEKGERGKLRQSCTFKYKIEPMDRKIRQLLKEKFGINPKAKRIGNNIVEKWIGFTYSEVERVKPSRRKYSYFQYPLIEMKMHNDDVINFFIENNLSIPPRSVCNACFANGLSTLKDMYRNRPEDWKQAVSVDNAVRNWSQIGVKSEVYVSRTLIPLSELERVDFNLDELKDLENEYSCDSGYCFL